MPMIAALSSPHLGAILFPAALRRLYVVRDNDPAGDVALTTLSERASSAGIEVVPLSPMLGDHNDDLRLLGPERMRAALRPQLVPADVGRFLIPSRVIRNGGGGARRFVRSTTAGGQGCGGIGVGGTRPS